MIVQENMYKTFRADYTQYYKEHKRLWIEPEDAVFGEVGCQDAHLYPRVFLFMPEDWGKERIGDVIPCHCGCTDVTRNAFYWRRVTDMHSCFYILSRRWTCSACKAKHDNDKTTQYGYSTMDPEVLGAPHVVREVRDIWAHAGAYMGYKLAISTRVLNDMVAFADSLSMEKYREKLLERHAIELQNAIRSELRRAGTALEHDVPEDL